jgi:hypothetical protein
MSNLFATISPKDPTWSTKVAEFGQYRVDRFILHSELWVNCSIETTRLRWERVKFSSAGVKSLPARGSGIYSFVAEPEVAGHNAVGYLLYVGKAQGQSLRNRLTSYLCEPQKDKPRIHIVQMLRKWPNHLWLHYALVSNETTIGIIEDALLEAFLPPFNRRFPASIARFVDAEFS